jgi:hypothetical protein
LAGEFTLAELAKIETDTLRKSVIDTLLWEADLMQEIPWETIGQLSTTVVRIGSLPSVGFRKVNEGYSSGTAALEQVTESISLMGAYFDTDKAIARAKNTIADARAIVQAAMLKAMAYKFNDKFINGDPESDPEEFKGLKERIEYLRTTAGGGYTGQYIDNGGTAGDGVLLDADEQNNFLDKIDQLCYAIKGHSPDFLLMNDTVLLVIRSVLRRRNLLDTSKDMFDRTVDMYRGARMVDIGCKADQTTEIITNTETLEDAGAAESTSIYAVKFGIGDLFWGIQEYPLEVDDKGLLEGKPVFRTEVDWPLGLAQADPYAIARLYAIIPNNST